MSWRCAAQRPGCRSLEGVWPFCTALQNSYRWNRWHAGKGIPRRPHRSRDKGGTIPRGSADIPRGISSCITRGVYFLVSPAQGDAIRVYLFRTVTDRQNLQQRQRVGETDNYTLRSGMRPESTQSRFSKRFRRRSISELMSRPMALLACAEPVTSMLRVSL